MAEMQAETDKTIRTAASVVRNWSPRFRRQVDTLREWLTTDEQQELAFVIQSLVSASAWSQLTVEEQQSFRDWVWVDQSIMNPYRHMSRWLAESKDQDEKGMALIQQKVKAVFAYSDGGRWIQLQQHIGSNPTQLVFLGMMMDGRDQPLGIVVVKWVPSSSPRSIQYEIDIWNQLHTITRRASTGPLANPFLPPLPDVWTGFRLWDQPVLVLEYLAPLDLDDSPYRIGRAMVRMLHLLHSNSLGVYNDLKPGNILKSRTKKTEEGYPVYYLVDFGGMATERKHYGWNRFTWSSPWAFQIAEYGQVTTPKYDWLELASTLRNLRLSRYYEGKIPENLRFQDFGTAEPLYDFIELIRKYPETQVPPTIAADLDQWLSRQLPQPASLPSSAMSGGTFSSRILCSSQSIVVDGRGSSELKTGAGLWDSRPTKVLLACPTPLGAVQDYDTIVLKYESYSGPFCWRYLPDTLRKLHSSFSNFAERKVPHVWKSNILTRDSISRDVTRPARILLPCSNQSSLADYKQIVLEYHLHAGKDCWNRLPTDLKQLHSALVSQALAYWKYGTNTVEFQPPPGWKPIAD